MSAGLEVADVLRRHGDAYRRAHDGHLGRVERRTMSAIELCWPAQLGGHVEGCRSCGAIRVAYNSCRNRHCPKCQGDDIEPEAESAAVTAERLAATHRCPCCGEPMITLAVWRCGQAPPSPCWNDTS